MGKVLITIMGIILMSFVAKGQQSEIHGIITNEYNLPVAYCVISIKGTAVGTYADDSGRFVLPIANYPDTLVMSCIGYQMQEKIIDSNTEHDSINVKLLFGSKKMDEITIAASKVKPKEWILGAKQKYYGYSFSRPGEEIGMYFHPDSNKADGYLRFIYFYIAPIGAPDNKFRVHIYKKAVDTFLPGEDITDTNLIAQGSPKGGEWVKVDISNKRIPIKEGVFISMEWLSDYGNNNKIQKYTGRKSSLFYRVPKKVQRQAEENPILFKGQVLGNSKNTFNQKTFIKSSFVKYHWTLNNCFLCDSLVPMIYATYVYYK